MHATAPSIFLEAMTLQCSRTTAEPYIPPKKRGMNSSPDFPDERLIACRNPFLAQYRTTKREALLSATEVELQKIALAIKRQKRALRETKIAL